ncbi:hypothetical protein SAMN02927900_04879 [Rhizobium mongolense subsp. loessense]|uniref:Uncharacterized protein n=1 Tax=Rhizobium mongolense subsp. loessense TaxID=158890 RepID=A0A1G4T8Z9_9HYPH|nr:hypothetical protein SAMN02927900_04879 [Rhizobium mongolense subsp. loessense]
MGGLVDFIEFSGGGGFIGHSYFSSDPAVKADLVALIRDRVKAGDPRRQLVEIKRPFWQVSDVQQASRFSALRSDPAERQLRAARGRSATSGKRRH